MRGCGDWDWDWDWGREQRTRPESLAVVADAEAGEGAELDGVQTEDVLGAPLELVPVSGGLGERPLPAVPYNATVPRSHFAQYTFITRTGSFIGRSDDSTQHEKETKAESRHHNRTERENERKATKRE